MISKVDPQYSFCESRILIFIIESKPESDKLILTGILHTMVQSEKGRDLNKSGKVYPIPFLEWFPGFCTKTRIRILLSS